MSVWQTGRISFWTFSLTWFVLYLVIIMAAESDTFCWFGKERKMIFKIEWNTKFEEKMYFYHWTLAQNLRFRRHLKEVPKNSLLNTYRICQCMNILWVIWAPSSEFVSSSIPSRQILTAHAQPFRGARDLVFCLKVPLDSLLVWASSGGSGETARMRRLAWTFAARIGDKYQIRLTRSICFISLLPCNENKNKKHSLSP